MDSKILALVGLRGLALALAIAGQSKASAALYTLADAAEAGKAIDDQMALVAEKLKNRSVTDADWTDVVARINADSARLQGS